MVHPIEWTHILELILLVARLGRRVLDGEKEVLFQHFALYDLLGHGDYRISWLDCVYARQF